MKIDYKSNKFKVGIAVFVSFLVFVIFLVVFFKRYKEKYKDNYALEEPDLNNYAESNKDKEGYQKKFNKAILTDVFYQKQLDSTRMADSLEQVRLDSIELAKIESDKKTDKKSVSRSIKKKPVFKKDTAAYSLKVPDDKPKNTTYKKKTTKTVYRPTYKPEVSFYFKTTDKYQNYTNISSTDDKNQLASNARKFEAVIYGDQEINNGSTVSFKSVNDIRFGKQVLPKHTIFFGRAKFVGNRINVSIFQAVSQVGNYEVSMTVFDNDYQEGIFHNFGFVEDKEDDVEGVALDEVTSLIPGQAGNVINKTTNISKKLLKAHEKSVYLKDGYSVYIKYSK